MSDDIDRVDPVPTKQWKQVIAGARGRASYYMVTAPTCDKCGRLVATRGRSRHFLCEPDEIIGHACSCPTGCSDTHVGNGSAPCDPNCVPCRRRRGAPLMKRRK